MKNVKILYDLPCIDFKPVLEYRASKISESAQTNVDVSFAYLSLNNNLLAILRKNPDFDFVVVHLGRPSGDGFGDAYTLAEKIRPLYSRRCDEGILVAESTQCPSHEKEVLQYFDDYTDLIIGEGNLGLLLQNHGYLPKTFDPYR